MALMVCPECGKEISDTCRKCPHCGYKFKKKRSKKAVIIMACVLFLLLGAVVYEGFNLNWSPEELGSIINYGSVDCLIRHSWVDADCTRAMHCSSCGSERGTALGHEWIEATCTEAKHCSECGLTEGEALGHTWVAATCTEAKYCSTCGEKEGNPEGHKWVSATCKEPKHCQICGLKEGNLADHKWTAATCTSPKKCTVCGLQQGSALGHNFSDYLCTRCGRQADLKRSDVPNILNITKLNYNVNSVGGIKHTMNITNKSSKKTIKYIDMEFEMYNAVGDVLTNDIKRSQKAEYLSYVGPLGPGKSTGDITWAIDFYNNSFRGMYGFKSITIEYTDGTKLKLGDDIAYYAVVSFRK